MLSSTDMHLSRTGIKSKSESFGTFCHWENIVQYTYTNLDGIASVHLDSLSQHIAPRLQPVQCVTAQNNRRENQGRQCSQGTA